MKSSLHTNILKRRVNTGRRERRPIEDDWITTLTPDLVTVPGYGTPLLFAPPGQERGLGRSGSSSATACTEDVRPPRQCPKPVWSDCSALSKRGDHLCVGLLGCLFPSLLMVPDRQRGWTDSGMVCSQCFSSQSASIGSQPAAGPGGFQRAPQRFPEA